MTTTLDRPGLGQGIYTFPEAARILRGHDREVSVRQLRYWMNTGLAPATHHVEGEAVLTFDDLISLEVVRRLRAQGASLHNVRTIERALREEHPDFIRPFAYEVFFTDGAEVWAQIASDDEQKTLIQLTGRKNRYHVTWLDAVATFAKDIRFEGQDRHATRWSLSPWVVLDPKVQYGAPVVKGSRVPLSTIAANLEVGSPEDVAEWYGLRVQQVLGVRDYLATS